MHGSDHMLEPSVLGRRKNPPSRLQLMDLAKTLDPRVVDDLALGDFRFTVGNDRGEGDIVVDGIVAQADVC